MRLDEDPLMVLIGQAGDGLLEALEVVVAEVGIDGEQHLHVGVAQHPPQLLGLAVGVEEDGDAAHARDAEPPDDPVGAVAEEQPDPRALADSGGKQRLPQLGGPGVGSRVREPFVAEDAEDLVAAHGGSRLDELAGRRREVGEAGRAIGHGWRS